MKTTPPASPRRILRPAAVAELIPVHPTTRYRWELRGIFPRRIVLGPNMIGYFEDEIEAWIETRQRQVDTGRPSPNPKAHNAAGDGPQAPAESTARLSE